MKDLAKNYALKMHENVNQFYGVNVPYSYHLEHVVSVAYNFIDLIPLNDRDEVICALWLHDVIEDCRVTYNDLKKEFNERIADIVYAVTNEKGKNRKERANEKYYEGIRNTEYATFVKLCDRIANVEYSKIQYCLYGDKMFMKYQEEHKHFMNELYYKQTIKKEIFHYMWNYINIFFNINHINILKINDNVTFTNHTGKHKGTIIDIINTIPVVYYKDNNNIKFLMCSEQFLVKNEKI